MEQTKTLPPLVSDDLMYASSATDRDMSSGELRRIYEADRAKTREVVQSLVDAIQGEAVRCGDGFCQKSTAALALAKAQLQIEPTKP